eukprot:6093088-Amphidinium_carterae.1
MLGVVANIFERLRRRAAELKAQDANYPYDPSTPWNHVFMMAVTDSTWWSHEVVEPSVMVMSRATSLSSQLAGDAP